MRIVQTVTLVSADGAFGGPLAVAIEQCRELARRGHDVTLLAAWDGQMHLSIPGVRVVLSRGHRIPRLGFIGVRAPALKAWLSSHHLDIDLVHVHAGRHALDLEFAALARNLGLPFVLQTHGMIMPRKSASAWILDKFVTQPLLSAAASVLVLTDEEALGIRNIAPTARISSVRNGFAPTDHLSAKETAQPEVLFLARLHPRKRVAAFAEMAKLLSEAGVVARFSVVGPDEGDLRQLDRFIAANPEVGLRYEGPIAPGKGATRIAQAQIYVLPSYGEVFPVTVLEALAAGTAVVLTADCGIADRLRDADAASVSDGTPADLAAHVRELLEDRNLLDGRTRRGRGLIDDELGVGTMVDELERHYAKAEKRSKRPTVLWVTNQAAPYRIPLWTAMSERVNLEVCLLESDHALHRDRNNRGTDWEVGARAFNFSIRNIPTLTIHRGEARHYVARYIPRELLRNVDAVLIGGWDSPAYWSVARQARKAGVRSVGFYESHLLSQHKTSGFFAAARRWFFRSLDGVVVPGVAAQNALLKEGVDAERISVGFNAVDVDRIHEQTSLERERFSRPDNKLRLLVVGQLIQRKNIAEAIRAMTEPGLEQAHLSIVGTGPLDAQLKALITQLDLKKRVELLGYVNGAEMPRVYAKHDALIHPATEEVWGLVINEALAAGLHVIVSDRCGAAPSVRHMMGVTVTSTDSKSIAEATRLLLPNEAIPSPEILTKGPQLFAQVFIDALLPASPALSHLAPPVTVKPGAGESHAEG